MPHNWQVDIDMLTDSLGKDAFEWRRELRWILNGFFPLIYSGCRLALC